MWNNEWFALRLGPKKEWLFLLFLSNIVPEILTSILLLLLLSHFSRVRLCDPRDGSPQAPPFLGFSRQEHWSGLRLPSAMHESEKWKWSHSVVSNPQQPHGLQPSRLLCPWDFPGKSTGVGCHCHLHVRIWYLSFSFWLQLCIIGSRFIHPIRTDSNAFLFMAE